MNIEILKANILKLNLYKWKLIQTNINSLVIFKTKYKYTDCIYINIDSGKAHIKRERVFDNKYLKIITTENKSPLPYIYSSFIFGIFKLS